MRFVAPGALFEQTLTGLPVDVDPSTLIARIVDPGAGGTPAVPDVTDGFSEDAPGTWTVVLTAPDQPGVYDVYGAYNLGDGPVWSQPDPLTVTDTPPFEAPQPGAPYATRPDVEALNSSRTFTDTSKPSADDVDRYLADTAAVLDGILRARGYQLPVPTTAIGALKTLRHYNALGGHAHAERSAQASQHADAADKLWAQAQKMLRDGLDLDLARETGEGRARAPAARDPLFTLDMDL